MSNTNLSALDRLNRNNQKDRRMSLDSKAPGSPKQDSKEIKTISTKLKKTTPGKKKKAVFSIVDGKLVKTSTKKKKKKKDPDVEPKKKKKVKTKKKKVKSAV